MMLSLITAHFNISTISISLILWRTTHNSRIAGIGDSDVDVDGDVDGDGFFFQKISITLG